MVETPSSSNSENMWIDQLKVWKPVSALNTAAEYQQSPSGLHFDCLLDLLCSWPTRSSDGVVALCGFYSLTHVSFLTAGRKGQKL